MRRKIVAGNWKMNKSYTEAQALASEIIAMTEDEVRGNVQVIFGVPFPYLIAVKNLLKANGRFAVSAQDCSQHEAGAYTGEVSASMIASTGTTHVIIGHSERRQYFKEDGKMLAKKIDLALKNGLTPIFCCGEPLEVREKNGQDALVQEQVKEALFHLDGETLQKTIIAYEPVWAIGTGKTATAQQAQDMHAVIRKQLASKYGEATANTIPILYGGSVNAANAKELFSNPDVDGGLVGGASLKSKEFLEIIKSA